MLRDWKSRDKNAAGANMSETGRDKNRADSHTTGLFGLSVIGVAIASVVSVLLFMQAGTMDGGTRRLAVLASIFLFAYAAMALAQARRLTRQRFAAQQRALEELESARQRAEEANQEKSRLLATITHELRTPMNGVIGMAALLRDTELTPEQENYVKAIEASGRSLLSIIDELLNATRPEAGGFDIVPAPFDLTRTVEKACELLSPRAHAKNIEIACYIDPKLTGRFWGDAARLRQILINLAGNAIKFTDSGGVLVRVTPDSETAGKVRFEVVDSGIGISEEDQETIFEPYRQVAAAGERRKGGTGLGLAISRRLVERMGGDLRVRSSPGEGSTFHFTLPLPKESDDSRDQAVGQGNLQDAKIGLAVPAGPTRQALADYIAAFGGHTWNIASDAELKAELTRLARGGEGEIICDESFGESLKEVADALGHESGLKRVWLLLRPEDRRRLRFLMEGGVAGFLLRPLRRDTFLFRFVERRADETVSTSVAELRKALAAGRETTGGSGSRPVALLVEDNAINAMLASAILGKTGYEVIRATTGEAALEHMRKVCAGGEQAPARPRLILMDVHMPQMDGPEATRRIRALEAELGCERTPILALTASAGNQERERCLVAGMDGFLAKPFDKPDLVEAIGKLLDGRSVA